MFRTPLGSIAGLTIAILVAAPQMASAYDQLPRALSQLTPQDVATAVTITDKPGEPIVVLSTSGAYASSRTIKGAVAHDVHLRALLDRRTGEISWQVWHDLVSSSGPKQLNSVQYRTDGETRHAKPIIVQRAQADCPPTDAVGFCNQLVRVAFELPEQTVREIAANYRPGTRDPWRVTFKVTHGRDVTGGLAPAEAAGLLQAVDAWRQKAS